MSTAKKHDKLSGVGYDILPSGAWSSLTNSLKAKNSPLKTWFFERFPSDSRKAVIQRYRDSVGPLLVPASAVPTGGGSGTIGGSFDHLVRYLVRGQPDMRLPTVGALQFGGRMPAALEELSCALGKYSPESHWTGSNRPPLRAARPPDSRLIACSCWALALLTEVGRGVPPGGSPLARLDPRTVNGEDLLGLASPTAVDQLAELRAQAESVLLPALWARSDFWEVGPTFAGSELLNADADLVAYGTLVEIKTSLGQKRRDGSRYATLETETLLQIIGYVLLDFEDGFAIRELVLFNARYRHLATWQVIDLLKELGARPVELANLRSEFERFLCRNM